MKKTLYLVPILALATAAWAAGPMADRPEGGPGDDGPGMHEGMGGGPGMEEGGGERMKEKLGLSDEQVKKLKALREGQAEAMKANHRKMRDLMAKLEDQVSDKASDSAIAATLKDLKAARKDMEALQQKMEEGREAILTPSQLAKGLLAMRGHMGMGGGMMGHERGGDRNEMREEGDKGPRHEGEHQNY